MQTILLTSLKTKVNSFAHLSLKDKGAIVLISKAHSEQFASLYENQDEQFSSLIQKAKMSNFVNINES